MSDNYFQYEKTPTGSLSGESMATQTEDAINAVALTAENARKTVYEAQATIETAINTAQNAQEAAQKGLIEIRQAISDLNRLNIPSGEGNVGKFLGTNGTALEWQNGMRYRGTVANESALPTSTSTHGTLVSGNVEETALATLQEITAGGFNILSSGTLYELEDLDFTEVESFSDVATIIDTAISSWGDCTFATGSKQQTVTETLYCWVYNNGEGRIYAKDSTLSSTSALYNADGSAYTGSDYAVAVVSTGVYGVTYQGAACVYTSSANLSVTTTTTITTRVFTITTTATGTTATISTAMSPTSSEVTDISSVLQLSNGTATNGEVIVPQSGDVYYITSLGALKYWNGTSWNYLGSSSQNMIAFDSREITETASTPQSFALSTFGAVEVYEDGILAKSTTDYTVDTSTNTVTFTSVLPVGMLVQFVLYKQTDITAMPIASTTNLGYVKVGSGLAVDANGVLSTDYALATNAEIDAIPV